MRATRGRQYKFKVKKDELALSCVHPATYCHEKSLYRLYIPFHSSGGPSGKLENAYCAYFLLNLS